MARGQMTRGQVQALWSKQIRIGYCGAWYLTRGLTRKGYGAGVYGWNYDVFGVAEDVAIVTGYRPFGNCTPDYETVEKFEARAKRAYEDGKKTQAERLQAVTEVLADFVREVTK